MTVIGFVKDFRLKRVAQLLVKNQLDINKIGYMADYSERCYFSNNLKRFGHSPKKYMEQLFRTVEVNKTFPVLEESFHHYFL